MTKGKFGLSPAAIAVIAFGFAALRQPQSVLLVCGFALLAERDEWLNRQAMQALLLTIVYDLAELVASWIFGGLARVFGWLELYRPVVAVSRAGSFVNGLLYLALMVFSVLAIVQVLRGKDAGLPVLAKMAGGDFAAAIKPGAVAPPHPAPTMHGMPYTPPPPAPPHIPPAPSAQAVPAPAAGQCPACSAPLQEDSRFCTKCGAKTA